MSDKKVDPNKQYLSFDALKFIGKNSKQNIACPKKELCEEDASIINCDLQKIKKMQIVETTYYNKDHYETIKGAVSEINYPLKYIKIIKTKINFSDIYTLTLKS